MISHKTNHNNNNINVIYESLNNSNYNQSVHNIKEFYRDAVILVTGGTGFLGKVLIEKLLRSCENIRCIYVLLRPKSGLSSDERCTILKENKIFERIRLTNHKLLSKIIAIAGDISQENIGLTVDDQILLCEMVTIVFHSAATIRFDQPLKDALNLNTLGSKRLWDVCCKMNKLKSIIHVSTAYSNPTKSYVEECVYPAQLNIDINGYLKYSNVLSDDLVYSIASEMQGYHPNTYTLTKAMAEQLTADYYRKLPISIIRPSIVTASIAEPHPGWVDNINGITGIMMEIGRGTISSIMCEQTLTMDLIPVDIACNTMITAAWLNYYKPSNSIRIYNCTSGNINPIKWNEFGSITVKYSRLNPTKYVMMYPNFSYRTNRLIHLIYEIFLHFLPALLFDCFLKIQNRKPMMFNIARRYKLAADTGEFFAMHEWNFDVTNVKQLIKEVELTSDGIEFNCDVRTLKWDEYIKNYMLGIRKYVLKDDDDSLYAARKTIKKLYITKWIGKILFLFLIYLSYHWVF